MKSLVLALLMVPALSFADGVYTRTKLGGTSSGASSGIGGSISANQVAVGSGANTIGGSSAFTFSGGLLQVSGAQVIVSASNTFMGVNAGNAGGTASVAANTAIGNMALNALTGGSSNTMVGRSAGVAIGNGLRNTGIGAGALGSNTGSDNLAIGVNAGGSITTATGGIYIGNSSFGANTNGTNQMSIGNVIYGTSMNGAAQAAGRIGINVNLPTSNFQVSGTAIFSSRTTVGATSLATTELEVFGTISATQINVNATGTCTVSGTIRYNAVSNTIQFCDGSRFVSLVSGT